MDFSIVNAIQTKHLLTFMFKGHWRVVEPHTYGADDKRIDRLSAWQVTGKRLDKEDWRWYTASDIQLLLTLPQTFAKPRDGYRRNDDRMRTIYAQL